MSKLYTEEQLRKVWNTAYVDALPLDNEDYKPIFYDDFIASLTPIELPTYDKVTRLEVISENGRELVKYGVNVELQLQDEDRTLKVFTKIKGGGDV